MINKTAPAYLDDKRYSRPRYRPDRKERKGTVCTSFIDMEHDGSYSPAILVRLVPKENKERYRILKSQWTGAHVSSYRRNWSHRNIALFEKKKGGPALDNIKAVTGSFLELDGGGPLKTTQDVYRECQRYSLPTPTFVIQTSPGHFHVKWEYERPLPWTPKLARWWKSQQKRLVEAFNDFGPDGGACMNPVQFLRNPSQLNAFNHKRKCEVLIQRSPYKCSLSLIQKRLDHAGIRNERLSAEAIIRQDLRARQYIQESHIQWGESLGLSEKTMRRAIPKLIANGDLSFICYQGNNRHGGRKAIYESHLFFSSRPEAQEQIDPCSSSEQVGVQSVNTPRHSQDGHTVISKTNPSVNGIVFNEFNAFGASEGVRNKTLFACGLYVKWKYGDKMTFESLDKHLNQGYRLSGLSEKEYIRTLNNVLKEKYNRPLSINTLIKWDLIKNGPSSQYDNHNRKIH